MRGHRFRSSHQKSTAERGYGPEHRRERELLKPKVEAGRGICQQGIPGNGSSGTCLYPDRRIIVGQRWALGHNDARTGYIGEVHARCNQRDAASRGAKVANAARKVGRKLPVGW